MKGLLLLLLAAPSWAVNAKPYIPAPVPVNIKPSAEDERLIGAGYNRIDVVMMRRDNYFGPTGQFEDVGRIKVTADNAAFGLIRNRGKRYTEEWDLIAGKLDFKTKDSSYRSGTLGKDVAISADGDGFDLGVRYMGGYSLAKTGFVGGRQIDWNLALSLHAALYTLDIKNTADSAGGVDSNHYEAKEKGLFLRPAVSIQPIIEVGKGVSFVPYVGASAMVVLASEDWKETKRVVASTPLTLRSDEEFRATSRNLELITGFDIGFLSPLSTEHHCTIGGALTQLYGGSSGDFKELHFFYAIPFGKKSKG